MLVNTNSEKVGICSAIERMRGNIELSIVGGWFHLTRNRGTADHAGHSVKWSKKSICRKE